MSEKAQPNEGVKQKFQNMYEALSRRHAMRYAKMHKDCEELVRVSEKGEKKSRSASGTEEKEEETKDQDPHRTMMRDMADKTNVCTSDLRYQEMLSFMTEGKERNEGKGERGLFSKQGRCLR